LEGKRKTTSMGSVAEKNQRSFALNNEGRGASVSTCGKRYTEDFGKKTLTKPQARDRAEEGIRVKIAGGNGA